MPTKSGKSTWSEYKRANSTGKAKPEQQASFVQYELSKEEQARCKAWDFFEGQGWEVLLKLCEEMYKITLKYDLYTHAYACWLIAPSDHKLNANRILPGRGSTAEKAFKQCCFKHYILFEGQWPEPQSKEQAEIDD